MHRVVANPVQALGPVQLLFVGLQQPDLPLELGRRIEELARGPAVNVLDMLVVGKDRGGAMKTEQVLNVRIEYRAEPGLIIESILTTASAAKTMGETVWPGPAHLFRGDILPDPRMEVPDGTSTLALLLEHCWAINLRETAADLSTYPLSNGWIGRPVLKSVGLLAEAGR